MSTYKCSWVLISINDRKYEKKEYKSSKLKNKY